MNTANEKDKNETSIWCNVVRYPLVSQTM